MFMDFHCTGCGEILHTRKRGPWPANWSDWRASMLDPVCIPCDAQDDDPSEPPATTPTPPA